MPSMFHLQLEGLAIEELPQFDLKSLPLIEARFALPHLDEGAPGSERLLDSLKNVRYPGPFDSIRLGSPSKKGKEREVIPQHLIGESGLHDVWAEAAAGPSRRVFQPLKTWDDYDFSDSSAQSHTGLMSENNPSLFDALTTSLEPCLDLPKLPARVPSAPHDSDKLLRLMMRTTLGTTTTERLIWDRRSSSFRCTDQAGRVKGMSETVSSSSIADFTGIGTAIRRLELMLDTHSTEPRTPTHHAMLHSISTYLTYIKTHLSQVIEENTGGWQQSSMSLTETRELCKFLCQIMCWPVDQPRSDGLPSRAASLLTHIYSFLLAHISTSPSSNTPPILAAAYILDQSSGPFLTLLRGWLGLCPSSEDEDLDPDSQPWSDLGITRTPLPPSESAESRWTYEFSAKRMPAFIPRESRKTLFEAGKSLRLLKKASGGQHPLCETGWNLEVGWNWAQQETSSPSDVITTHVRRIEREIKYWRRTVKDRSRGLSGSSSLIRLRVPKKERKRLPVEFTVSATSSLPSVSASNPEEASEGLNGIYIDDDWAQFELPPGTHLGRSGDATLWAPTPLSAIQAFIECHSDESHPLLPEDSPSLTLFVSTHLLSPLLVHARLVSRSLVSLYLDDLHLLDHYDILKAFFLAGDVGFTERVSAALFGRDEAGAGEALGLGRRARTRVRLGLGGGDDGAGEDEGEWGIGLGLGLSERARWPPGGSELAYALRTTLVGEGESAKVSSVWEEVEERVSFAVRNLPENEEGKRARWMDPQAIEALDFLYLSYSPPPSIAPLLPASLMAKYQSIHNLLLRLSRVKTVIRSLYIDATHPTPIFDEPIKQGVDAGSRPPSRVAISQRTPSVRKSIFPEKSSVGYTLHRLRFRMSCFMTALEEYLIDTAIGTNWDVMRRRLDRLKRHSRDDHGVSEGNDEPTDYFDHEHGSDSEKGDGGDDDDDEDEDAEEEGTRNGSTIIQLQSAHSLVAYHHLILDRILRAALLSPSAGHQITFKILNGLFGLILDLGKVIKLIERGVIGWEDGADKVEQLSKDWGEKETIFLHALERLSLRTHKSDRGGHDEDDGEGEGEERDLQILLSGEKDGEDDEGGHRAANGGGQLAELLVRLDLGRSDKLRQGRWKEDAR